MTSSSEPASAGASNPGGTKSRRRQPVLVLPGFGVGDGSTIGLRSQIAALGHPVHRWHQITLGSPLNSTGMSDSPPPVPLTSIWSRNDRVVRWQSSIIEEGDRRQNIEVRATHVTLGFDPLVVAAIADRLAQRPERWKPFRPPPLLDLAYPRPGA